MHTDNYNSTARRPAARFNQIYLKLRERDRAGQRGGSGERGAREIKERALQKQFQLFFFFFFLCLIFCKMLNNCTGILC